MKRKSRYDSRKENFIQKTAIVENISVSEARLRYIDYEKASDKNRRKIMRGLNKKLKERSSPPPLFANQDRDREKGFQYPKTKQVRRVTKPQRKKEVRNIQKIRGQTQGHKTQKRVVRASVKYPNASKYELQHGVNSKASQRYRARRERNNER